jgi:hypothetical protein
MVLILIIVQSESKPPKCNKGALLEMNTHEPEAHTLEQVIESLPDEKSKVTAEIMRRFNEVFLRHDPSALESLVAEDCVIEKISPAPDGDRCVGREACVAFGRLSLPNREHTSISRKSSQLEIEPLSAGVTGLVKAGQCAE